MVAGRVAGRQQRTASAPLLHARDRDRDRKARLDALTILPYNSRLNNNSCPFAFGREWAT